MLELIEVHGNVMILNSENLLDWNNDTMKECIARLRSEL